jgi:hypothetical protein
VFRNLIFVGQGKSPAIVGVIIQNEEVVAAARDASYRTSPHVTMYQLTRTREKKPKGSCTCLPNWQE